jgi:anhydro-N-acetylmuramic acid kinase
MTREAIDVVGFHGQTVIHRPEQHLTIQLGDGALLAELIGLPVVFDLRGADVAAGGQGAPLVPVYHRALVSALGRLPVAVVNIGGVANVTWTGTGGELFAFDTGPGNALIDDWMLKRTGQAFDDNGTIARRGSVHADVLTLCLSHDYFAKPPPKSLDRNAFVWDAVQWMSVEDGAATLTAFTAAAIARSAEHFPAPPELWVICGGGRHNPLLMDMLTQRLAGSVVPAEAAGLDGDSIEAEAWAYLAVRSLAGLPITFPRTTGVAEPMTGGILARPRATCRLNRTVGG